jgi:hypothetical protein
MCNIIKNSIGKMHLPEQVPSLLINNEKVKDPEVVSSAFNDLFLTTADKSNLHQGAGICTFIVKRCISKRFSGIKIIPNTEAGIKSIVNSLKSKNLYGYDEITSKILKAF